MGTLHGNWVWYELTTPDPEGARAFYEAVVGWSMTAGHGGDTDYGFIANTDGGMTGGMRSMTKDMTDSGARPSWLGYIGVDNVDTSVAAIERAGGKTLQAAADIVMAGRVAMVADCCGAPFYVITPNPPPDGGESTAFTRFDRLGRCSWNELMATNGETAVAFYTALFGWSLPEPMDMGPMGKYHFIEHDAVPIGAIMTKMPSDPVPHWNHYFRVASIEIAQAAVKSNGGQVINGPMQVPGDEWIIQGIDPQGATFALVGGK